MKITDLKSFTQCNDVKKSYDLGDSSKTSVLGKLTFDMETGDVIINIRKVEGIDRVANEFKHA